MPRQPEKVTMTMVNGDTIEIDVVELAKFDRAKNKQDYTFECGIRIYRNHVVGIYPAGMEPTDELLKSKGRKKISKKRIGGAKGKQTLIKEHGEEIAMKLMGKGITNEERQEFAKEIRK
jgi:hypothetical protein